MEIFRNALRIDRHQSAAFGRLPYRAAPDFLGEFTFCPYRRLSGLPRPLLMLVSEMMDYAPSQIFNTAFVQRYQPGQFVRRHRDPMDNKDFTLIAVFGDFEGAVSEVDGKKFQLLNGDLLKLECTIDGVQGPPHSVSPVLSGTRYALILNTIEYR